MKKHILALTLCVASALGALATDYEYSLAVNLKDGSTATFKFEEGPVATFDNENLILNFSLNDDKVVYPIDDLANLSFVKKEISAVEGISADGLTFGITRNIFEAEGLTPGARVAIYAADGSLAASASCDASGAVALDISSLPGGVFLVKAGNKSFKFIR